MFSPPLKKSIVFLKYALKMDLVKGAWFDLYDLLLQTGSQFFNPPNKISNKKIASSAIFPLLIIIFIRKNDPERVRTVDLRRDRAAL